MGVDPTALVLRSSLVCAAAIAFVILLRYPARRWLGAAAAYRLWLIVPLAMAASLLPQPMDGPAFVISAPLPPASETPTLAPSPTPLNWLLFAWAAGVVVSLLIVAARQFQFLRMLGRPSLDAAGLPILRSRDGYCVGPAVIGVLSPRIVLPADFESRYSPEEQRVILAHERAHLFGHDAQANGVAVLLQCLNWFNPLAHLAARLFRIDQELAADATVVAQFPGRQRVYAEALLKTQMAARSLPLGCQWPVRSDHPLRRRVTLLANAHPPKRLAALAVIGLSLGASLAAWAATPRIETQASDKAARIVLWTIVKAQGVVLSDTQARTVNDGSWTQLSFKSLDGVRHTVHLNPTVLATDNVRVRTRIDENGTVTEAPPLLLKGPEPGVVHMKSAMLVVTVEAQRK